MTGDIHNEHVAGSLFAVWDFKLCLKFLQIADTWRSIFGGAKRKIIRWHVFIVVHNSLFCFTMPFIFLSIFCCLLQGSWVSKIA